MSHDFKPIQVLPLGEKEKRALVQGADSTTKVYQISFNLSAQPPARWAEMFQSAWYRQYGGGAIPRVSGSMVQVTSSIAEIQNALSALKLTVATANERYRALFEQKNEEEAAEKKRTGEAKRAAERAMSDALDKLKF